jgi:hypothetical protein
MDKALTNESLGEMLGLLQEVDGHLNSGTKADMRKAITKLDRIAALASTLALTIRTRR